MLHVKADLCIGKSGQLIGELSFVKQGAKEYSAFAYNDSWLANPERFEVSPDLPLVEGHTRRRAPSKDDSCFFFALADTEPDAWGLRIISRAHAKERKKNPTLPALNPFDYLCSVDDFSRVGALRLRGIDGRYLRTVEEGRRATPPLLELQRMYSASRALELNQETTADLKYLQGKGTSLGGMRPKCTLLDDNGSLALGKFPSIEDARSVTRGEVLALELSRRAGIESAQARIVMIDQSPVAVITRFDRTQDYGRIHYLSAASMLQARRNDEHAYTEIADIIRSKCLEPTADVHQLWRRLVFNLLITNVDDHLQNLGFLYVGKGLWRLAPSFDVNPFPDKDRESKTWLSEDMGPITSLDMLIGHANYFGLNKDDALRILRDVRAAVSSWRTVALSPQIGLLASELDDFAPAFEHADMKAAQGMLGSI